MAQEGRKIKTPFPYPKGLDKYIKMPRLPTASLPAVRRIIEGDEGYRTRIAAGALPELVDPLGRVWLGRQPGWQAEVVRLAAEIEQAEEAADAASELKKATKRREAAEQAAARAQAELVGLAEQLSARDEVIQGLRVDVAKLDEQLEALRLELVDARTDARHARDRANGALTKVHAAEQALAAARAAQGDAEVVRDGALADRAALAAERSELARLVAMSESLAQQLAAIAAPPLSGRAAEVRRKALPMPGGIVGDSQAAAEYLLRSGASVLVDGYNVAKSAWPKLDVEGQRVVLLDAVENLARRFGCDITVVFDGADIIGAAASSRRVVRVVYSPVDVIADDVIRDEVRRLPATRQVVVVTNDQEIVRDVRSMGANAMSSDQLIALMR
jgi:predicted RNA-binding protein with PIN domain